MLQGIREIEQEQSKCGVFLKKVKQPWPGFSMVRASARRLKGHGFDPGQGPLPMLCSSGLRQRGQDSTYERGEGHGSSHIGTASKVKGLEGPIRARGRPLPVPSQHSWSDTQHNCRLPNSIRTVPQGSPYPRAPRTPGTGTLSGRTQGVYPAEHHQAHPRHHQLLRRFQRKAIVSSWGRTEG